MRLPSIWTVAAVAALFSASLSAGDKKRDPDQIGNRNVGKGINFYSIEKEIALGKQLAEEVARQSKLLDDPIITEYVSRLGQNLVRNSDATIPFKFQIVEGDQLNAFALPGGFIFVNTGLIEATETEAELAGAIAHEGRARRSSGHWRGYSIDISQLFTRLRIRSRYAGPAVHVQSRLRSYRFNRFV